MLPDLFLDNFNNFLCFIYTMIAICDKRIKSNGSIVLVITKTRRLPGFVRWACTQRFQYTFIKFHLFV